MNNQQKELKKAYRQTPPPMGVWQIRNLVNEKVLIGASLNLPGVSNRQQFQLQMGSHPNKQLQADWRQFGGASFVFEILDEITPNQEPGRDQRAELEFLEDLWLEKLEPYGERGYNERKKTKEERLQQIIRNKIATQENDDE
jgi:hypothetical protein